MQLGFPITQTIYSDTCWVCNTSRLKSQFEEHHVVPKCYGGEKGPCVSLCTSCHTLLHKNAEKIYANKYPMINYKSNLSKERSLYLSTVVANARHAIEDDGHKNKKTVFTTTFNNDTHTKLVKLTRYYKMSQKKLIEFAITHLYQRNFKE